MRYADLKAFYPSFRAVVDTAPSDDIASAMLAAWDTLEDTAAEGGYASGLTSTEAIRFGEAIKSASSGADAEWTSKVIALVESLPRVISLALAQRRAGHRIHRIDSPPAPTAKPGKSAGMRSGEASKPIRKGGK